MSENIGGRPRKSASGELTRKVLVSLTPEVHDWLKAQPAGVSATIDAFVKKAMKKEKKL